MIKPKECIRRSINLNNKAFTFLEVIASLFIVSSIVILLFNFSGIQKEVLEYEDKTFILFQATNNEISEIYQDADWSNPKDDKLVEDVVISYSNYKKTIYNTESLTLTLNYKGEEWSYVLERMD